MGTDTTNRPAPHSGGGAAPDQVTIALLHRRQLGMLGRGTVSNQQRRVLRARGVAYVGTDAQGRPVVEQLQGFDRPQRVHTWAVLRSGDPTEVARPVRLVQREQQALAELVADVAPGPDQCAGDCGGVFCSAVAAGPAQEAPSGPRAAVVPHLPVLPAPTAPSPELARRRNLAELRAEYVTDAGPEGEPARYVLVEASTRDRSWWLTFAPSPEAAADYHDTQEYADDWQAMVLVDLETGQRWAAHTEVTYRTRWQ